MSRKELKQVDPVTEGLSSVLDAIVARRKQILSMFVVLLFTLVGIGYYQDSADDKQRIHQAEVSSAFSSVDLSKPEGLAQLDALIKNNEGTELAAVATIIRARYAASSNGTVVDAAKVRAAIKLLGTENPMLRPWSNLNLALQGEASLETVSGEGNPASSRILANMMLGDRNHPGFGHGSTDAGIAREAYRSALALVDESLEVPRSTREMLRAEITTRIALLPGGSSENLSKPAPAPAAAAE
jgi:hypothetical protein